MGGLVRRPPGGNDGRRTVISALVAGQTALCGVLPKVGDLGPRPALCAASVPVPAGTDAAISASPHGPVRSLQPRTSAASFSSAAEEDRFAIGD